jgi:hypothetical protein
MKQNFGSIATLLDPLVDQELARSPIRLKPSLWCANSASAAACDAAVPALLCRAAHCNGPRRSGEVRYAACVRAGVKEEAWSRRLSVEGPVRSNGRE